jgi:hypothetical protein
MSEVIGKDWSDEVDKRMDAERKIIIKMKYKDNVGHVQVRVFSGHENTPLACNGVLAFTKEEWEALYLLLISHRLCVRRADGSLGEAILTPGLGAEILLEEE